MNKELLIRAYQIIDGIPQNRFNLQFWCLGGNKATDCGTVACAAGWLALNPEFQKMGFKLKGDRPLFKGETDFDALAKLFDISEDDAGDLFGQKGFHRFDESFKGGSDKALWQHRVKRFLKEHA